MTAAGKTSEIRVHGSVQSNYRTAYDILVRPNGSALPLEREDGLVRDNYLSGLFGGITLGQYREIKSIPGVDVAAPVANIGYVIPSGARSFTLNSVIARAPIQLYRVLFTTIAQNGTSRYPLARDYIYFTRRDAFTSIGNTAPGFGEVVRGSADPLRVCPPGLLLPDAPASPFWTTTQVSSMECYSARSPGVGSDQADPGKIPSGSGISFPILLAAIDPVEEARLLHLDRALVGGRYLREADGPRLLNLGGNSFQRLVPVIASTRTYVGEHIEASIERLAIPPNTNVPLRLAADATHVTRFLDGLAAHEVARRTLGAQAIYDAALAGVFGPNGHSGNRNISWSYWTSSPVRYRSFRSGRLVPITVKNPLSVWRSTPTPGNDVSYAHIPQANADVQFRRLHPRIGSPYFGATGKQILQTPTMSFVGRYDPTRLPGFSPLSRVPLETYYPPELLPGDQRSKRLLRGHPLLPSENIGDYVAQPPLFLTTLDGMAPFLNSKYYAGANSRAPISVIRVRVKGATGPDAVSQARVRQVATEIHDRTGLQVDITAGSSPKRLHVALPPGRYGRPALLLQEGWSKKGVSVSFLRALDQKRLGLLALILVACVFFLANGAFAAVRGRRREIGTLLCLGWPRKAIFAAVITELVIVGLLAGVGAAGVAAIVSNAFSLRLSQVALAAVVPLALALGVVSGLVPAWRAARIGPLDAVHSPVSTGAARRRVVNLTALALANVRRVPGRSIAAAAGLFIAAAVFTLLLSINQTFQGHLVGTLLGNAVSVEVRGLDFLVVGVIVLLATLSLADVLFLNLRERAAEITTLRTLGWADSHLARVVAAEAVLLSLLGTVPGALLGLVVSLQLGVPAQDALLADGIAIVGGFCIALVASLLPLARLTQLTTPAVLAEE
ncbi:MAG: FtsX-like permease family protein [Gaiellaceae bacterium]